MGFFYMKCYFYILFSKNLDTYYLGHTSDSLEERIRKHHSHHKGFTAKTKDWELVYFETFSTKSQAYQREMSVKKKKSRKYIEALINASNQL